MYPNPQDALPLPPRPTVAQYETFARELVEACRSEDRGAIRTWVRRWVEALAAHTHEPTAVRTDDDIADYTDRIDEFARAQLIAEPKCAPAAAQFVLARVHGFLTWPELAAHIEASADANSPVSGFEAAASTIVRGDVATLERLLRDHPELIRQRSTREHRATLLHYVSANGVEGYRQVSPTNIAEITRMLLAAGAEVDAGADVYESQCTALGLVATSAPPDIAGVQRAVIDVLLEHGARMDRRGIAGRNSSLVRSCLANGQPGAADHLVSRGAPLDLAGAAGLGRVDALKGFVSEDGTLNVPKAELLDAFSLACAYGRATAVEFLLDRGMAVNAELKGHGEGHTGLHVAAYHGHIDVVRTLLARGADVNVIDKTWHTPPLIWALTGWTRTKTPIERSYEVARLLVAAGATVTPDVLESEKVRADPRMRAALTGSSTS